MARIRLSVLVHDDWREQFPCIVANCRRVGMSVERELIAIGVIRGTIEEERLVLLQGIEGVAAIEPERSVRACRNAGHGSEKLS